MKYKLTLVILIVASILLGLFLYGIIFTQGITLLNFYRNPTYLSIFAMTISFYLVGFSLKKAKNKEKP